MNSGRRDPPGCLAACAPSLGTSTRLQVVGFAKDLSFTLPISQADIGEATGISTVHANRVIQDLRSREQSNGETRHSRSSTGTRWSASPISRRIYTFVMIRRRSQLGNG